MEPWPIPASDTLGRSHGGHVGTLRASAMEARIRCLGSLDSLFHEEVGISLVLSLHIRCK